MRRQKRMDKKWNVDDRQGTLLLDVETSSSGDVSGVSDSVASKKKGVEGGGKEDAVYGGLDIDGLIGVFAKIAKDFGAKYTGESWNGEGAIVLYPEDDKVALDFIGELWSACRLYRVHASFVERVDFSDDVPCCMVRCLVPGRVVSGVGGHG